MLDSPPPPEDSEPAATAPAAAAAVSPTALGSKLWLFGFGGGALVNCPGLPVPSLPVPDPLMYNPYCTSVSPSPARLPCFAACVVWSRYVRRKPTSWNDMLIMPFQMKEKTDPTGRPSTYTSSPVIPGATIVVSQYGGVASAAACS